MALFIGGPADGWRIDVDTDKEFIVVPVNPHPPAFTTDDAIMSYSTGPGFTYKREEVSCELETYNVYVPSNWNCSDLIDALIMGFKPEKDKERLRYVRTAEGQLYDTDDRIAAGRPYSI